MKEEKKNNELEFDELMKLRMQSSTNPDGIQIADERLKEMSKKLPAWSLEPPSTFLR